MPVFGVKNFIGSKLAQARKMRGLSSASLADMVGVSLSSISLYEKDKQNPKQEVVDQISMVLNVPAGFFFSDTEAARQSNLFYRSMASATKKSRQVSEAKYDRTLVIVDYLLDFFDFPKFDLPDFEIPSDFRKITSIHIELAAQKLRDHWQLGDGPITNMIRTLEANGVVVWRTLFESETQDAFSENREPHPFIVLSTDKNNYFRSRTDAAHELGHLVLHRNVDSSNLTKSVDHKDLERQANAFASAFLLPGSVYARDLRDVSLDQFRSLKPKWNTSIAMQIIRAFNLGMIDETMKTRMFINLTRRGWRKSEPLDADTPTEKPNLILSSIKMLIEEGVKSKEDILCELNISPADMDQIIERPGYFKNTEPTRLSILKIVPKKRLGGSSKVIPFRSSKT